MLTLPAIFVTSFVVALSGALMPGPLFTVTVSESSRRGAGAGPLLILGHGILELTLVVALVLGVGPLLQKEPVFVATALGGSLVLVWMAFGMLRGLARLSLAVEAERGAGGNLVLAGIVLSLVNPYWTIWWVSIGLGYISHSLKLGILGVAVFFCRPYPGRSGLVHRRFDGGLEGQALHERPLLPGAHRGLRRFSDRFCRSFRLGRGAADALMYRAIFEKFEKRPSWLSRAQRGISIKITIHP